MTVSEKQQKTRVYKLAKELNLSHDTLIEFLIKKGFDVKNHMSIVDDEMLEHVERHFKKEKVDAERHARKRKEFDEQDRRRRGEERKEETKTEVEIEEPAPPLAIEYYKQEEEIVSQPEPIEAQIEEQVQIEEIDSGHPFIEDEQVEEIEIPEPLPEIPKEEILLEEIPREEMQVEEIVQEEIPREEILKEDIVEISAEEDIIQLDVEEISVEEIPEKVDVESGVTTAEEIITKEPRRKEKQVEELDVSIEASMPKMGIKVMGKIDLSPKKPAPKQKPEPGAKKAAESGVKKSIEPAAKKADELSKEFPVETTEDKPKHKKKKKKRIISEEKPTGVEEKLEADTLQKTLAKKGKKTKTREVDAGEVNEAIKRTIASMGDYGPISQRSALRKRKKARREEEQKREIEREEQEKHTLRIYEYATVSDLANLMNISVAEVISSLISLGVMASINQRLDLDTITLVASEFGYEIQKYDEVQTDALEDTEDLEEDLITRPPIVTIMGHVDHGKTSLLDYIRNSNVVAGESGGITQHIGAYTVTLDTNKRITFLDTPGHEAFTAMRARGAQITDIVVLVVAADDSVMPQTIEAISHALAAKVPIVVAINKIDKPESNPDRIKQQLADRNLLVEEWGGKYGAIPISAKKGINIDLLLERILLEADILDLKANPDRNPRGVIIESRLDKGKGVVATVLVQKGTLRVGDSFVAGNEFGKVRALLDERGHRVEFASPSTPVQVLGFNGLPQAGDTFVIVDSDREAREAASVRQQIKRESDFRTIRRKTLDDISAQIKIGGIRELSLIVKGDVDGSVEALSDSLLKLSTEEVIVNVIHKGVGAISESDVLLASASDAIIIGFHVRPHMNARRLAESEAVDIRLYDIIYNAINDVKKALEGLLKPEISERILATVLVRDTFKISKIGTIAGCYVQEGKINRNNKIRLLRDGIVIHTGKIDTLKRFKDDVREVDTNFECGICIDGFNDIKVGDVIEAFEQVETKRSLD